MIPSTVVPRTGRDHHADNGPDGAQTMSETAAASCTVVVVPERQRATQTIGNMGDIAKRPRKNGGLSVSSYVNLETC